ncbi:MAG: CBS domain-containing protein [Cytophagales bacterium]|jgi:transaldolase|nr:CBS domain-containing protein [Cytophagales bacterium]MCA6388919.1 CBS domain-containing protein [Cytophagales bacterium]MCA6391149.1 CBS domain-containing protein [Cytophagales bacterium]MCA6395860.1 CBS domain-containing protein [Cytophagales bacterium]MCA6397706.1 CBS domain-containing protein [Cytophagales bacterium]
MELYLDSADLKEIEEAFQLGFLNGLTTTPTFMHRGGVTDVDGLIVKLSKIVPVLQIEALGNTAEEVLAEAKRQLNLGLDPKKTVFKIPVSLEGVKACNMLRKEGLLVNVHLVYTLQQAYMAMHAGATYVCPLVGRLQDQGHDALDLVAQCVNAVDHYGYDTKIMFSSVRYAEHVRNAINIGVHTITAPWKVMKALTDNNLTALGTQQFVEHTKLMTVRVKDILNSKNPIVSADTSVTDALVKMTEYGFGSITVTKDNKVVGVFTDGDLRRKLQENGREVLAKKIGEFQYKEPVSIDADALLNEAADLFKRTKVDTILVTDGGKPVGMLDIQDLKD